MKDVCASDFGYSKAFFRRCTLHVLAAPCPRIIACLLRSAILSQFWINRFMKNESVRNASALEDLKNKLVAA